MKNLHAGEPYPTVGILVGSMCMVIAGISVALFGVDSPPLGWFIAWVIFCGVIGFAPFFYTWMRNRYLVIGCTKDGCDYEVQAGDYLNARLLMDVHDMETHDIKWK